MKLLTKTALALYLLTLTWLILFKFSADPFSVLAHYQSRSLNLIPFAGYSHGGLREMFDNVIVFIPFGLLLGVNLKQIDFWRKLALISLFSFSAEILQFIFAIGTTDITDVITNTLGGSFGLALYKLGDRHVESKTMDWVSSTVITSLLITIVLLRVLVFRVRY